MPLVKVEIIKGKTSEYKSTLLSEIHKALVQSFRIPEDDRIQRLIEYKASDFQRHPSRSDDYTLIEIALFQGRSREAKKMLYGQVIENLRRSLGIDPLDVFIFLNEIPLENWGIRGGRPADEVDLGFNLEV